MPLHARTFQSPYRLSPEAWDALRLDLSVAKGGGKGAREGARKSLSRGVRTRKVYETGTTGKEHTGRESTVGDLPARVFAWHIAFDRAGRLGLELADGKYALLCPWDDEHTTPPPDESAESAGGSCVLFPPSDQNPYGQPFCSHAHCDKRSLYAWAQALGFETYALATVEVKGWRYANGYLAHRDGISTAKKVTINLPRAESDQGKADDQTNSSVQNEGPFTWMPDKALGNFLARITSTVFESDGQGATNVFYDITSRVRGEERQIRVPAGEFNSLGWVAQKLGADAIIEPGRDTKDRLRAAIQHTSFPNANRRLYTFIGWQTIEGREVFLHGRGGIGADGPVPEVETRLEEGPLANFWFPTPLKGAALIEGIKACAALFYVGFPDVSIPLFAACWRAPLGRSKLSPYLAGPMKCGKSMFAGLAQSHFGPEWNGDWLPVTLKSPTTSAAIGRMLSLAGDVLFICDDYLRTGNPIEDAKIDDKVTVIVRGCVEGTGTMRMDGSTLTLRSQPPPRCLSALTGEEPARGHSLRSRNLVLQMPGPCPERLDQHMALAAAGIYAATMAAYLQWLAPKIASIRAQIANERDAVAKKLNAPDDRVGKVLAEVVLGVKYFADFARTHDALTAEELNVLREKLNVVLRTLGAAQMVSQAEQDPILRFLELLSDLLASGRGYLTLFDGTVPKNCHVWGWVPRSNIPAGAPTRPSDKSASELAPAFEPRGEHLGYIADGKVWIFSSIAFAAVQKLATATGDPLQIGRDEIGKRLFDRGLLAENEWKTRKTYTTRKTVGGKSISGLYCLSTETLRSSPVSDPAENQSEMADEHDGSDDEETK